MTERRYAMVVALAFAGVAWGNEHLSEQTMMDVSFTALMLAPLIGLLLWMRSLPRSEGTARPDCAANADFDWTGEPPWNQPGYVEPAPKRKPTVGDVIAMLPDARQVHKIHEPRLAEQPYKGKLPVDQGVAQVRRSFKSRPQNVGLWQIPMRESGHMVSGYRDPRYAPRKLVKPSSEIDPDVFQGKWREMTD